MIMRTFAFITSLLALVAFGALPALAHNAGSHCQQFGPDHSGCSQPDPEPEQTPTPAPGNYNSNTNTASGGKSDVDVTNKFKMDVDVSNKFKVDNSSASTSHGGKADADATAYGGNLEIGRGAFDIDNSNTTKIERGAFELENEQDQTQRQAMEQDQKQKQDQTAVGKVAVDSHDRFEVEGDSIVYEAPDVPVNSAAPVFAGACSQGVSGQGMGFGGSAATGNPVCDYVAVAGAYVAAGARSEALAVLQKAEKAADWRYHLARVRSLITLGIL